MHACGCLCFVVHKADGDCDCCEARYMELLVCVVLCTKRMLMCGCCEAMHACACLCALVHKAHAHCDCCDVMHACGGLCFLVHKADGDCDYCEARCMRVLVCVFLCTRRMLNVIAVRHDAGRCLFVCSCAQGTWSL
jgi:uncharacterized tellurite resistance protein B-like protein